MDLKDIFTKDVQKNVNGTVYIQALKSNLECIVKTKTSSYPILFIYNDSIEKTWEFTCRQIQEFSITKLICIFVNKNEDDMFNYHIINCMELLETSKIDIDDFVNKKDVVYHFKDELDKYLSNWKIIE